MAYEQHWNDELLETPYFIFGKVEFGGKKFILLYLKAKIREPNFHL